MRSPFFRILPVLVLLTLLSGCDRFKAQPEIIELSEAHKKFQEILKDDYEMDAVVRAVGKTLWVYVPLETPLFEMKAKKEGPQGSKEPSRTQVIKYLDGAFEDGVFEIEYDIRSEEQYAKDYGYGNNYSEEYRKKQRHVLTAVSRAYTDVKETSATIRADVMNRNIEEMDLKIGFLAEGEAPTFFVLVFADIESGIEMKMWLNGEDLKRGMMDHSFQEEYAKRAVQDYPVGHTSIVGDKNGRHVVYFDLSWPEFLMKQMLYRIRFKYQQSDFKPGEHSEDEILEVAAEVVHNYSFEDFTGVKLINLQFETESLYLPTELPEVKK